MKTIEEIRKAFLAMHHYATRENAPTYMSVPTDRERDADLILSDAIDELGNLRSEVTAAKADAARLREELIGARERICEIGVGEESDSPAVAKRLLGQSEEALGAIDAALAATDSVEWLAKHDAELVLNMREQNDAGLVAMNDSLTKQLNAATNDAARAELRARQVADACSAVMGIHCPQPGPECGPCGYARLGLEANPDSDERLREVMRRLAHKVQQASLGTVLTESELVELVEEELRGAP